MVSVGEDKVPTTFASEVGLFRDSSGCSPITSGFSVEDESVYLVWILLHHWIQFMEIKFLLLSLQKQGYSVIPHVVEQ